MGTDTSRMSAEKFKLLRSFAEGGSIAEDRQTMETLRLEGLLDDAGITELGLSAIEKYKVDNAIIMAAGFSARCMPLSSVMPKGLFQVRGEVLIEREIRQLQEAGIEDIIIVVGYMHEKFEYLRDKYGVKLLLNKDFDKYNNMSSLYVAQNYMGNSYILSCDNYYTKNVFHKYVCAPYTSSIYSEPFCDEYCITAVDEEGCITGVHRGGDRAWYTIGDAYYDRDYSKTFVTLMNHEWDNPGIRNMMTDDFHIAHLRDLKLRKVERPADSIFEFDTLEEFKAFDPQFSSFMEQNLDGSNEVIKIFSKYAQVQSYHAVPTETSFGRLHLNENLFKPSPACLKVLQNITEEDIYLYDLSRKDELVERLSTELGIAENNIFIHNGSAEVIKSIFSILLNENDRVLAPDPGWSYYKSVADAKFSDCITYRVREGDGSYVYDIEDLLAKAQKYCPRIIVITSPHMPTGCRVDYNDIERVIRANPDSVIVLDEAYWGYEDNSNDFEKDMITKYSNVVVSRTFSKLYGLAGIRIGYGLCSYPLKRAIGVDLPLHRESRISRKMAIAALDDRQYYTEMREKTLAVRRWFIQELAKISGVTPFESATNFVFLKLDYADAEKVRAYMEENNILIRLFMDADALRLRITIGPKDLMDRVLYQLKKALNESV